ncbi:hypothetical protein [Caenispirillum salinarum]|uniref:hypothetical protein n=1 Tax=Caenispirillum salinarum TaxID=859058 RepID=UPI00384E7CBF
MSPKTPFRLVAALLVALLTLNLPVIVSTAGQADALVPHDHGADAGGPTDGSHDLHQ